jgi:hypothetical protein
MSTEDMLAWSGLSVPAFGSDGRVVAAPSGLVDVSYAEALANHRVGHAVSGHQQPLGRASRPPRQRRAGSDRSKTGSLVGQQIQWRSQRMSHVSSISNAAEAGNHTSAPGAGLAMMPQRWRGPEPSSARAVTTQRRTGTRAPCRCTPVCLRDPGDDGDRPRPPAICKTFQEPTRRNSK